MHNCYKRPYSSPLINSSAFASHSSFLIQSTMPAKIGSRSTDVLDEFVPQSRLCIHIFFSNGLYLQTLSNGCMHRPTMTMVMMIL